MPARVLVVDSDRFTAAFARISLEHEGYAVDTAGSGREAERRFSRNRPDLLLIATQLPDTAGAELAARLRQGDSPPLLFLVPEGDISPPEGAAFVRKPVGFDGLLEAVRGIL